MSLIDQIIIDQSPVLSGMETNEIELSIAHMTPNIHTILLEYLITSNFPLDEQVWMDDTMTMIDFLMLPIDKLIDDCILFWQKHKVNTLKKYNINLPFTLSYKPKDIWCNIAATYGSLNVLIYVSKNGAPWTEETCYLAAKHGHVNCLQYAHQNGCCWDQKKCMKIAEEECQLECIKYMQSNGEHLSMYLCAYAIKKGNIECLKYAHQNGCSLLKAASFGYTSNSDITDECYFNCMKYCRDNTIDKTFIKTIDKTICREAAKRGHLSMLKYAHENGYVWDETTCHNAASKGNIECLKYAHVKQLNMKALNV